MRPHYGRSVKKIQPCLALVYLSAATRLERKKPSTDLTNAPATLRRQEAFKSCFSSLRLVKNPIQSARMAHRALSRRGNRQNGGCGRASGFTARIIDHQISKFDRQVFVSRCARSIKIFATSGGWSAKSIPAIMSGLVFFFGQCSGFVI